MFKHILVPTDGTELSKDTCRAAVALARQLDASVTAYHAQAQIASSTFSAAIFDGDLVDDKTRAQFEKAVASAARNSLGFVETICQEAAVPFNALTSTCDSAWEGILQAAIDANADLIFMASHARKGLKARLIGSQTERVLSHSSVPVLVYRWGDPPTP